MMDADSSPDQAQKVYAGSRYFREFISRIRKDEDAGKYEHLEDYPYDILVDTDLGLRLFHAGINPYDQDHFRHQIYVVTMGTGKAGKLCKEGTVAASSLTLQWTKRADMCNALLLSVKSFGQCSFAWCGDTKSRNRCGWCGHSMKTRLFRGGKYRWAVYRRGRHLAEGESHCCKFNSVVKKYWCCRCNDPDNSFMTPLDRDEAQTMPQSVLPTTLDGGSINNQTALVPASLGTKAGIIPGQQLGMPVVNHFNFYGNNHIYQGPPGGEKGSLVAPSGLHFSTIGMGDAPHKAMIDYPALPPHVQNQVQNLIREHQTTRVVEEVDDDDFYEHDRREAEVSAPRRPHAAVKYASPKYASPMVEDHEEDAADPFGQTDISGAAEQLSRLQVADKAHHG